MDSSLRKDVTTLLREWRDGDRDALNELMPLVYYQLRQLAARQLKRERAGHTLQSTALVHEAYLQLVDQSHANFKDREHFIAAAAQIMRHILVSHARKRGSLKRGGGTIMLALDESVALRGRKEMDLVAIDNALQSLSQIDPQQGRIVELRFFGGLSIQSTATVLGISSSTVSRDWDLARSWLHRELSRSSA
jgi:RNA polymerase sigma factor (TIGR02999 family)